jgi:hypothetical protein
MRKTKELSVSICVHPWLRFDFSQLPASVPGDAAMAHFLTIKPAEGCTLLPIAVQIPRSGGGRVERRLRPILTPILAAPQPARRRLGEKSGAGQTTENDGLPHAECGDCNTMQQSWEPKLPATRSPALRAGADPARMATSRETLVPRLCRGIESPRPEKSRPGGRPRTRGSALLCAVSAVAPAPHLSRTLAMRYKC